MLKMMAVCAVLAGALSAGTFQLPRPAPTRALFEMPQREPWMANIRRGGDSGGLTHTTLSFGAYSALWPSPLGASQGIEATIPLPLWFNIVARAEGLLGTRLSGFMGEFALRGSLPWPEHPHNFDRGPHVAFHADTAVRLGRFGYDPADFDEPGKSALTMAWGPVLRAGLDYGAQVRVFVGISGGLLMFRTGQGEAAMLFTASLEVGLRVYVRG